MGTDYVARARALRGCRFRLQGRDPRHGLDCVGLAVVVYAIRDDFRRDYRLRGGHLSEMRRALARDFRRISNLARRPGDLLLWSVATDQLHLGTCAGGSFVHADAGIGRIVETPGEAPWPLIGIFRRRVRIRKD